MSFPNPPSHFDSPLIELPTRYIPIPAKLAFHISTPNPPYTPPNPPQTSLEKYPSPFPSPNCQRTNAIHTVKDHLQRSPTLAKAPSGHDQSERSNAPTQTPTTFGQPQRSITPTGSLTVFDHLQRSNMMAQTHTAYRSNPTAYNQIRRSITPENTHMAFYQLQRTKIPPYTPPEDEQLQRSTIPTIPPAGYDYLQRTITPAETPTSYDQPQRDLTPASTLSFGDKYTSEKDPMAQNTINNSIEQNALYLAMIQFFSAYNSILAYRQQFSHLEKARYSHAWEINNGFKLVSSLVPIATVDYIIQAGIFSGREGDMARMEVQRVRDNLQGFLTLASEVFWKIDTENMLKLSLHAPVSAMMRLSASIDQLEKAQARCTAAFTETT